MKYETSPVCVYVCSRLALAYFKKSCTDGSAALLYIYDKHKGTIQHDRIIIQKVISYTRLSKRLVLSGINDHFHGSSMNNIELCSL